MLELTIRLVVSLAIVVGLLILLARFGSRRFAGRSDALVRVVHRQPLSRTSAVAVVTVGGRVLVLGTTEHQVSVLTEMDPEELGDLQDLEGLDSLEQLDAAEPAQLAAVPALSPATSIVTATTGTTSGTAAPRPARTGGAPSASRSSRAAGRADGALAGSVLSAQTWKQALASVTRKTS